MPTTEKTLKSVNQSKITLPAYKIFVENQVKDIEKLGTTVLTDPVLNQLLGLLKILLIEFGKGLLRAQKSDFTDQMILLDLLRDRAWYAYQHVLKGFRFSDDPDEIAAYHKLSVMAAVYRDMDKYNYAEQSERTTSYLMDVKSEVYSPAITTLEMNKYVDRIETTSTNFNAIAGSRRDETSTKEVIELIALRKSIQKQYTFLGDYVVVMANLVNTELFNSALNIMNTTRTLNNNLLRFQQGVRDAADEEVAANSMPDQTSPVV